MENLEKVLKQEFKKVERGGQLYFDSHGIYMYVSSTLETMPHEKFYLEKFRQMKLHPAENGTFDLLGLEDLKWQKEKPYQWNKEELKFISKSNNSEVRNFTWILVLAFTLVFWFLVVCGILFWF